MSYYYTKTLNDSIKRLLEALAHDLVALDSNITKSVELDPYEVLGITRDASPLEIRQAYRRAALKLHPDKNPSQDARDQFAKVLRAYQQLSMNQEVNHPRDDRLSIDTNPNPQLSMTVLALFSAIETPYFFNAFLFNHTNFSNAFLFDDANLLIDTGSQFDSERIRNSGLMITDSTYKNTHTFLDETPIYEIEESNRIVLDGYVFDVDELVLQGRHDLLSFYNNPHIRDRTKQKEFSPEAKAIMRRHPKLAPFANSLDQQLNDQTNVIKQSTIDAVIILLNDLNENGVAGSAVAQSRFLDHKATLSAQEQSALENYIISVPLISGGTQRMRFEDAFNGGHGHSPCIITTQIFLWQFVITHRPQAQNLIPNAVKQIARSKHMALGSEQADRQESQEAHTHGHNHMRFISLNTLAQAAFILQVIARNPELAIELLPLLIALLERGNVMQQPQQERFLIIETGAALFDNAGPVFFSHSR